MCMQTFAVLRTNLYIRPCLKLFWIFFLSLVSSASPRFCFVFVFVRWKRGKHAYNTETVVVNVRVNGEQSDASETSMWKKKKTLKFKVCTEWVRERTNPATNIEYHTEFNNILAFAFAPILRCIHSLTSFGSCQCLFWSINYRTLPHTTLL